MSKQSNEIYEATNDRDPTTRNLSRRDSHKPNRDEFVKAKDHADEVLGLDEKVSDGVRRALTRFKNSPLTLMMEILNDPEQPWERRENAAHKAFPYLHRKLEDQHGSQGAAGDGSGAGAGPRGPTINLTVARPQTATVVVQQTSSERHEEAEKKAARPKVFKKPAKKGSAK